MHLNNICRFLASISIVAASQFSGAANVQHDPNIYFVRRDFSAKKPMYFMSLKEGGVEKPRDIASLDDSMQFVECTNTNVIYLEGNGTLMQLNVKSGTRVKLGKIAYRPEHEINNKFVFESEKKSLVAILNQTYATGTRKVNKIFTVARYYFDGRTDVLYKGDGHVPVIQKLEGQLIRIYASTGHFDLSLDSGKSFPLHKVPKGEFDDLELLRPDLAVFSVDTGELEIRKGVKGEIVARIKRTQGFSIPLDYYAPSSRLLYVRLKKVNEKNDHDVLVDFNLENLQSEERGIGTPIIDGCYGQH